HRTGAPAEAAAQHDEARERLAGPVRPGQDGDPGRPDGEGEPAEPANGPAVDDPVGEHHPERHRGDEQRGEPGREGLLGIAGRAVAEREEHGADHRHAEPLADPRTVGHPQRGATGSSSAPAIRYLTEAMASGGMLSTPTRIATKVEPQTTQTTSRAAQAA